MSRPKRQPSLGVDWLLPGARRRFATSTPATSYLISILAGDGHTFTTAHDEIRYDLEAKAIVAHFIANGHGNRPMAELVG